MIGTAIIAAAVVSVFKIEEITWWPDAIAGISVGVLLVLSPDTLIGVLKSILNRFKQK